MTEPVKPTVVIHYDEEGQQSVLAWGDVEVLWIDERVPADRVYRQTGRSDPKELTRLLGRSEVGHAADGKLSEDKAQAIRAAVWKASGGSLEPVG